ncbi:hypothetical protein BA895_02590 [Humibacillus sp. DSM 29435]|uniref:Gmad2 immunoglobulin-like domain-containing protein n=1 Tax=Humibacillus sp. DSM 29435 TaxID=1869167 RepID=UPI000871E1A1|nr:Gmad2 immunoglobulin-like domain-containing protein [Humibacillus sp. DSM 29435]OFE16513.1 hypothetical protein BA895_02590 [Humibacillus sp. DSM 29435]
MNPDEQVPHERAGRAPRHPASVDPVMIGSELRDVEIGLRTALHDEAERITPSNRLDAILAAGRVEASTARGHRRWLLPVAAAAAAVVVVGGALVVGSRQTSPPPVVGGPTGSVSTSSSGPVTPSTQPTATGPSTVPTQTASQPVVVPPVSPPPATTSPTTSVPPAVVPTSVPVYYVGTRLGNDVLFREFVVAAVAKPVSPTTKVEAAVRTAMGGVPDGSGYQPRWQGVDLVGSEVKADGIRLTLSRGLSGLSSTRASVVVQQLVWTAQAAAAQGLLPVTFALADGGDTVAPGQPVGRTYNRPTDPAAVYSLLSPLWIDSPARGQVIKAGTAVKVTGVASTNEASVTWQLLQGTKVVAKGAVQADKTAPARGGFSVPLGRIDAGEYSIRVYEESAKDGSVSAQQQLPFTVK